MTKVTKGIIHVRNMSHEGDHEVQILFMIEMRGCGGGRGHLGGHIGAHTVPVRQQLDIKLTQLQIAVSSTEPYCTQDVFCFSTSVTVTGSVVEEKGGDDGTKGSTFYHLRRNDDEDDDDDES